MTFQVSLLLFCSSANHRNLHSFPTRRSSDLFSTTDFNPVDGLTSGAIEGTTQTNRAADINPADIESVEIDRKSTRLNSSHTVISYAVFCLKKKTQYMHLGSLVKRCATTSHLG